MKNIGVSTVIIILFLLSEIILASTVSPPVISLYTTLKCRNNLPLITEYFHIENESEIDLPFKPERSYRIDPFILGFENTYYLVDPFDKIKINYNLTPIHSIKREIYIENKIPVYFNWTYTEIPIKIRVKTSPIIELISSPEKPVNIFPPNKTNKSNQFKIRLKEICCFYDRISTVRGDGDLKNFIFTVKTPDISPCTESDILIEFKPSENIINDLNIVPFSIKSYHGNIFIKTEHGNRISFPLVLKQTGADIRVTPASLDISPACGSSENITIYIKEKNGGYGGGNIIISKNIEKYVAIDTKKIELSPYSEISLHVHISNPGISKQIKGNIIIPIISHGNSLARYVKIPVLLNPHVAIPTIIPSVLWLNITEYLSKIPISIPVKEKGGGCLLIYDIYSNYTGLYFDKIFPLNIRGFEQIDIPGYLYIKNPEKVNSSITNILIKLDTSAGQLNLTLLFNLSLSKTPEPDENRHYCESLGFNFIYTNNNTKCCGDDKENDTWCSIENRGFCLNGTFHRIDESEVSQRYFCEKCLKGIFYNSKCCYSGENWCGENHYCRDGKIVILPDYDKFYCEYCRGGIWGDNLCKIYPDSNGEITPIIEIIKPSTKKNISYKNITDKTSEKSPVERKLSLKFTLLGSMLLCIMLYMIMKQDI